jgi:hypothetical protein
MIIEKELIEESIHIFTILKKDAEMALDGSWDCTIDEGIETGFNAQIDLIDEILNKLKQTL